MRGRDRNQEDKYYFYSSVVRLAILLSILNCQHNRQLHCLPKNTKQIQVTYLLANVLLLLFHYFWSHELDCWYMRGPLFKFTYIYDFLSSEFFLFWIPSLSTKNHFSPKIHSLEVPLIKPWVRKICFDWKMYYFCPYSLMVEKSVVQLINL